MLRSYITLVSLIVLSTAQNTSGCGKPHTKGSTNGPITISSSGGDRQYIIHVPTNYDESSPTPLIVSYHGRGGDMYKQEALSQFSVEGLNPNMISVYPNGVNGAWQGPSYADPNVSDKVFTTDLLNHLRSEYCIDSSRIYANGKSNGGGFVDTLACSPGHGGDFAAFASCSGAFYTDDGSDEDNAVCQPTRSPMPFMEFHGSADTTIPYDGGEGSGGPLPAIPAWLNNWAGRNGCAGGEGETMTFEYDNAVNHTTWSCNGVDGVVDGYWIQGMGHDWPSTSYNDDNQGDTTVLDATPLILDFFRKNYKP